MGLLSYSRRLVGRTAENVNDVQALFDEVATLLNGNLEAINIKAQSLVADLLAPALAERLGVSSGGIIRSGHIKNPGPNVHIAAAFAELGTPDKVSLMMPAGGLLFIVYKAQVAAVAAAEARITINGQAVKTLIAANGGTTPADSTVSCATAGITREMASCPFGLLVPNGSWVEPADTVPQLLSAPGVGGNPSGMGILVNGGSIGYSNVTALVGGPAIARVGAGACDVSVQYRCPSPGVTVANRELWAYTLGV